MLLAIQVLIFFFGSSRRYLAEVARFEEYHRSKEWIGWRARPSSNGFLASPLDTFMGLLLVTPSRISLPFLVFGASLGLYLKL